MVLPSNLNQKAGTFRVLTSSQPQRTYSEADVSPKDTLTGLMADAQLIWGPDLEQDNTVLCHWL